MALVMLPCDVPWWPTVQRHLTQISTAKSVKPLVEGMTKIHNMCNIGLDPEEEGQDPTMFDKLETFLTTDLTDQEQERFYDKTLPTMARHALQLKLLKPAAGFHFSLQQQADRVEYDRGFVASLLAHAFFSTFPKRSAKTHPTLQDFNFTYFYIHLDNNGQKAKLRSILHYFDRLEDNNEPQGNITFTRKVMSSKEWLTIEDWLECSLPLCSLAIRHDGRMERADHKAMRVCFSSSRAGGRVLYDGTSQECIQFCTQPEMLAMLPSVEALEDNEVLMVEGLQQVARINDPRHKAAFEAIAQPQLVSVCCMDAENYTKLPLGQYEEDNVLRELNKALLGFRQQQKPAPLPLAPPNTRRLTPIGESFSSTPEVERLLITEPSPEKEVVVPPPAPTNNHLSTSLLSPASRRGRFIVLGSSGECLPVSRGPAPSSPAPTAAGHAYTEASHAQGEESHAHREERHAHIEASHAHRESSHAHIEESHAYSSCHSDASSEQFHSAKTSQDGDDMGDRDGELADGCARKYSAQLDTPERRSTFAERLRDALCRETLSCSSSTDSSYAVGISVAGSDLADPNIRVKRGGSRGFMLQEDSIDDQFLRESLRQEKEWIDKFRSKRPGALSKRDTAESSKYSFSTEYSSELEELYDQFSRWMDDSCLAPDTPGLQELDARDLAVVRFAGSLLKRTLSESFAGVSVTDVPAPRPADDTERGRSRLANAARSLSLELARHKHKLAAQLVSMLTKDKSVDKTACGLRDVATGNWGCGSSHLGDPQLKLIVQWLAASVAGVPTLHYYTCGHYKLHKLDTVCRVLLDRQWTVGELVNATVRYSQATLNDPSPPQGNNSLFDHLIGTEKSTIQRLDSQ